MFCSKCGNNLPEGVQFCPKCGATTGSAPRSGTASGAPAPEPSAAGTKTTAAVKDKPPRKRAGKALPAILLVAVLLVAALFLVPRLLSSPAEEPPAEDAPAEDTPAESGTPDAKDQETELLAIIDRVEAVHSAAWKEYTALEEIKTNSDAAYVEKARKEAQVFLQFLTELEELRGEADALSGLAPDLQHVRDEYFHMLHDARTAHAETLTFQADYIEFYDQIMSCRPLEVDYDTRTEYSEALSAWFQEAKEGYEAISYPASVESEWKRYGELLDYNESIAEKVMLAVQYNDWLRACSAQNMTARFVKAEELQFDRFMKCIDGEKRHAGVQYEKASKLAQEIHNYVAMTPEERDAYQFENVFTGRIWLGYDVVDVIYPSLYNTYDAFAIFETGCISGTRRIVVEAEIEGFTQKYKESFYLDSSYQAIHIKPPALTGELDLSSAKPAQFKITISETDGTLIDAKSFDITLKSETDFMWYDDEYGTATQDNILCFLTPEATAITELKRQAASQIKEITGGMVESFWGYQTINSDWNQYLNTYLQAAGLMSALNKMGVRYVMNSFALSGDDQQHITLPEDVLANRSGLCIETSLVIASALQSAGMHAFLAFPHGHAMVAVEVWNRGENAGKYFLIETTAIEASASIERFNAAAQLLVDGYIPASWEHDEYQLREPIEYLSPDQWNDYLENYFEYVIDCNDSRLLGLTPFAH